MQKNIALVLVGMMLGCGAGAYATHSATAHGAPKVIGQRFGANPSAPRWEQTCSEPVELTGVDDVVGKAGAEGWELAAMSTAGTGVHEILCFKRPAPK